MRGERKITTIILEPSIKPVKGSLDSFSGEDQLNDLEEALILVEDDALEDSASLSLNF